jgi:hypothetical protein
LNNSASSATAAAPSTASLSSAQEPIANPWRFNLRLDPNFKHGRCKTTTRNLPAKNGPNNACPLRARDNKASL